MTHASSEARPIAQIPIGSEGHGMYLESIDRRVLEVEKSLRESPLRKLEECVAQHEKEIRALKKDNKIIFRWLPWALLFFFLFEVMPYIFRYLINETNLLEKLLKAGS